MTKMHPFNSQKTGPKILPIFNMRKRPRQALYAVPSGQVTNNNKVPADTSGVNVPQTLNRTHPGFQNDTSKAKFNSSSSAQFKGKWEMPSNPYGSTSFQSALPQSSYQASGKKTSQPQSRKIQPAKLLPQNQQNNFPSRNLGQYQKHKQVVQNTYQAAESKPFQPQPRLTQSYQRHTPSSFPARPGTSGMTSLQPNTFKFTKKQEFKQQSMVPSSITPEKTSDKRPAKKTPEEKMRILTLSVEGVKKWSQILADDGMLMFEVFGLLSTDVDSGRGAKKFMLKDGSHTLQCIFYETDRSMPPVTNGQWVRCVGIFQSSITTLQCVSIRPVEPTEQRWMKQQMGACEKALKSQLAIVKMEP